MRYDEFLKGMRWILDHNPYYDEEIGFNLSTGYDMFKRYPAKAFLKACVKVVEEFESLNKSNNLIAIIKKRIPAGWEYGIEMTIGKLNYETRSELVEKILGDVVKALPEVKQLGKP